MIFYDVIVIKTCRKSNFSFFDRFSFLSCVDKKDVSLKTLTSRSFSSWHNRLEIHIVKIFAI